MDDREIMDVINQMRGQMFEMQNRLDFLYQKLNIEYVEAPDGTDPRLVAALKKGKVMDAIAVYRSIYNCSLADAKSAVEGMWAKYKQ